MTLAARSLLFRLLAAAICISLIVAGNRASAQDYEPRFDRSSLESMLAPIALYPDPLLSQVLMASTYPSEIAEAAQWSRERPGLSGDAAVRSSEGWDWDPSVRSLLAFPQVLDTLARHMRWTEDLGEAFLAQSEDVMDAVQRLRRRAHENGTLRPTDYTRVTDSGREIAIEYAAPQVAYVPYYDPRVVYGSWWWPSRPPVYWAPWPGYASYPGSTHLMYWGPGISVSSGFFFGGIVWPRREVRIVNVDTYYYRHRHRVIDHPGGIHRPPHVHAAPARNPGVWRHDESRRRGPERGGWALGRPDRERGSAERSVQEPRREPGAVAQPRTPPPTGFAAPNDARRNDSGQPERPRFREATPREPTPRPERTQESRRGPSAADTPSQRQMERREGGREERREGLGLMRPAPDAAQQPGAARGGPPSARPERQAERNEQRATDARSRRDDGEARRGPPPGGGRQVERGDGPGRQVERGSGPGRQFERGDGSGRQMERSRSGGANAEGGRPPRGGNPDRPG